MCVNGEKAALTYKLIRNHCRQSRALFGIIFDPTSLARPGIPFIHHEILIILNCRGVAQSGSATALGAVGRWFESNRPDHLAQIQQFQCVAGMMRDFFLVSGKTNLTTAFQLSY